MNTHGGLLSQAHIDVTEAARQLRGNEVEAERQVKDAKLGVVSGQGGSLCMNASLILGHYERDERSPQTSRTQSRTVPPGNGGQAFLD